MTICRLCDSGHLPTWCTDGWFHLSPAGISQRCENTELNAKLYFTEYIKFAPTRAWVVLDGKRKIVGLHVSRAGAEQQCLAERHKNQNEDFTFTKGVVLPNFRIEGDV